MSDVAVIGGAGFIGSRLVEALDGPRVIDRKIPEDGPGRFRIDVRDRERLIPALEGVGTLCLLAAEHRDDVEPTSLYYDVNVGGAKNVVEAAVRLGIQRILFTSTVAIYGLNAPDAGEDSPPDPFNDYARSKWQAEQTLVAWAKEDPSRSLVIVRPCVIFGEGNRGNVYNLLSQLAARRFLMVGNGTNRKSMAYVGNLVALMTRFLDSPNGIQVFNYADKPDLSMKRLLQVATDELGVDLPGWTVPHPVGLAAGFGFDVLARLTRRKLPISAVRVRKFCANTTVNTDRLASTGFEAPYSLEEGLRRMIRAEFPVEADPPRQLQEAM